MPSVACPSCKAKLRIPETALGKKVKCPKCATPFRLPAAKTARTATSQTAKATSGPPPQPARQPAKRVASSIEDELFSSAPPPQGVNPLGDLSPEDLGFAPTGANQSSAGKREKPPSPYDAPPSVLENPALRARKKAANPYAAPSKSGRGSKVRVEHFTNVKILAWVIAVTCTISAISFVTLSATGVFARNLTTATEETASLIGGVVLGSLVLGVGCWVLTLLLCLIYWPIAHSNVKGMGATNLKFSPGWMVGCWFVPLANFVWPFQGVSEIYRASLRPGGSKWEKADTPGFISAWWTLNIVSGIVINVGGKLMDAGPAGGGQMEEVGAYVLLVGFVLMAISAFLLATTILKIASLQHKHAT